MWLLIMVLLIGSGLEQSVVLQAYPTPQECESERNRIGYEMAKAYPDDLDFALACKVSQKQAA